MSGTEKHFLVPKHTILAKEEAEKLLEKLNVKKKQLPLILKNDAAIKKLKPQAGEIIRVERESHTTGVSTYYRVVK